MSKSYDDDRLKHLAQVTANAIAREYNSRYASKIPIPVPLEFDLELSDPKSAAHAMSLVDVAQVEVKAQKVKLNMTLYRDNVNEFLNSVIAHEIAHLRQRWDDVANKCISVDHGYVWQIAMSNMNQLPKTKHRMDTSKAIAVYKEHKAKKKLASKEREKT